jgi:cytoskeleton protein RodZ
VDQQFDMELGSYLPQPAPAPPADVQVVPAPQPVEPEPAPAQHQASVPEREIRQHHALEPLVPPKPKTSGAIRAGLALIVLLAALAGLLIQYQRMQEETPPASVAIAPPVDTTNAATLPANAIDAPGNAPVGAAQTESPAPAEPVAPSAPVAPLAKDPPPAAASSTTSIPASSIEVSRKASSVAEPRTPGMQQLTITARPGEICWVQVNDGQQSQKFTLRNGESKQVEFASRVRLRLGNAGGVSLRLNGQDYPFEGKRGSIETVEIGAR